MPRARTSGTRRRWSGSASARSWSPTGRTGCGPSSKEADHVGLSGSVPATCFPTASALGSSWNPDLFAEVGEALGREASRLERLGRARARASTSSARRCAGATSSTCPRTRTWPARWPPPWCSGIQSQGVGTSVKHFAANNQEDDRLRVSAEVDERTLREIYLPAFEAVVKDAAAVDGDVRLQQGQRHVRLRAPLAADRGAARRVGLRRRRGRRDWGAVHDRVAAAGRRAGPGDAAEPRGQRRRGGRRRSGPASWTRRCSTRPYGGCCGWSSRPQPALAEPATVRRRRAPRAGPAGGRGVGGAAEERRRRAAAAPGAGQHGRGDRRVRPDAALSRARAAPRSTRPGSTSRSTSCGAAFGDERHRRLRRRLRRRTAPRTTTQLARRGRRRPPGTPITCVVFLGLPASAESEGFDRTHMDLPANQLALLEALAAVHDRLIVVLANGSVVRMSTWEQHAAAILECWLGGQAAGGAAADLLTGAANPSGKLAETIPLRLEDNSLVPQLPGRSRDRPLRRGPLRRLPRLRPGRPGGQLPVRLRAVLHDVRASPTSSVEVSGSVADGDLSVRVSALRSPTPARWPAARWSRSTSAIWSPSVARPVRELKGFAKVFLEPGESRVGRPSSWTSGPSRSGRPRHRRLGGRERRVRDRRRLVLPRSAAARGDHARRAVAGRDRWTATRPCTSGWPTSAAGPC